MIKKIHTEVNVIKLDFGIYDNILYGVVLTFSDHIHEQSEALLYTGYFISLDDANIHTKNVKNRLEKAFLPTKESLFQSINLKYWNWYRTGDVNHHYEERNPVNII